MSHVAIDPNGVESGSAWMVVLSDATASSLPEDAVGERNVPAWIPASQRYFWTSKWQRDELESLRDIESGDVRRFVDPLDAVRWLLSSDDES